jgi:phosphatidylglycerophosphatase A
MTRGLRGTQTGGTHESVGEADQANQADQADQANKADQANRADETRNGEAGGPAADGLRSAGVFGVPSENPGIDGNHGGWSRWVAVAGGLGCVPVAPGTAGSLLGVLIFVGVAFGARAVGVGPLPAPAYSPVPPEFAGAAVGLLYSLGVLLLFWVGVRAAGRAEIDFGRHDDGRIVIDEVVGQLITLSPVLFFIVEARPLVVGAALRPGSAPTPSGTVVLGAASDFLPFFLWLVTGFVLFRLFDVLKPGAIRWAERRFPGGLGVMADDAVAGVYGAAFLLAAKTFGSGTEFIEIIEMGEMGEVTEAMTAMTAVTAMAVNG